MKKYYFHINYKNRKHKFEFYYGTDNNNGKEFLDHAKKISLSLDDVMLQIQAINEGLFETVINTIKNKLSNAIEKKKRFPVDLTRTLENTKEKYSDNIVFLVLVNILENEQTSVMEEMHIREYNRIGIPVSHSVIEVAKRRVQKKYQELQIILKKFDDYINEDFRVSFENTLVQFSKTIIIHDGTNIQLYYDLCDSFEALIFFITRHVDSHNLRFFCCSNCGRKFFNKSDRKYCPSLECQHVHKLELDKQQRLKRKQDCYINLLDSYYAYVRQVKRILKLISVNQSDMSEFESQQKKCADMVKSAIIQYRSKQKPIDDELLNLVKINRAAMKAHGDTIRMRYFN